jgi:hypothetical protein
MATLQQIREALHRQPFRPFLLQMANGTTYIVKHHDFIAIPPGTRGRELVLYTEGPTPDDPVMHLIDLALVLEVVTPAPGTAPNPPASPGNPEPTPGAPAP